MAKANESLKTVVFIAIELCYLAWGTVLAIYLPILTYLASRDVVVLGVSVPFVLYAIYIVIVGLLYLLSVIFMARRRPVSFKLAAAANILGIPLLVPVVIGLISIVVLNRPEIKEQFKK
jgi:hypothetical protein